MGPLELAVSQQTRLRRLHGSRAYVEATKELRIELEPDEASPRALLELLGELVAMPAGLQGRFGSIDGCADSLP
jgi:hypothetical protein